jgi:hypothetical protein
MGITVYSQPNGFEEWDPTQIHLPCILKGYFQFYPALQAILPDVRTQLIQALQIQNQNPNHAFLHVRRGDYVQSPQHHPTQDVGYYLKALEIIGAKNVYVFSDDIGWCNQNLSFGGYEWNYLDIDSPYVSMYLMTKCENNIICNSSFSWWGAWLNRNGNKKVISPIKWFGPLINKDTSEICPSDWIRI